MKNLDFVSALFVFLGAINWGLVGVFNFNLIDFFIANEIWDRVVYVVIGASAIYHAIYLKSIRVRWKA